MARHTKPAPGAALKNWEHPKNSGIHLREVLNRHGGETFGAAYLVTLPSKITGKNRERKQFKGRAAAEEWANKAFLGYRKEGEGFFALSDTERREVAASLPLLREKGISISEAVQFAIKGLRPEGRTKTLREVVAELTASKAQRRERGDLRERSEQDFRHRGEKFACGFEGRLIAEITGDEIKAWLNDLKICPRSNQNYLAAIGEVFKFATQKRYVAFSPLDHLTDVDRKELCGRGSEAKEPSILTPDDAERLLKAALDNPDLDLLGAVTLGLFCGLRTEEIKRLDWKAVRLAESSPSVIIGAKIAKKRRFRHVDIPPVALPWLALVPSREGQVTRNDHPHDYQKRFRKLFALAKFDHWDTNAMRHSFGSYHYALHGNPLETSRLLGHKASDQVLFDHYRALATKTAAEAYFSIRPPASGAKIVRFA
jgi:integrase